MCISCLVSFLFALGRSSCRVRQPQPHVPRWLLVFAQCFAGALFGLCLHVFKFCLIILSACLQVLSYYPVFACHFHVAFRMFSLQCASTLLEFTSSLVFVCAFVFMIVVTGKVYFDKLCLGQARRDPVSAAAIVR